MTISPFRGAGAHCGLSAAARARGTAAEQGVGQASQVFAAGAALVLAGRERALRGHAGAAPHRDGGRGGDGPAGEDPGRGRGRHGPAQRAPRRGAQHRGHHARRRPRRGRGGRAAVLRADLPAGMQPLSARQRRRLIPAAALPLLRRCHAHHGPQGAADGPPAGVHDPGARRGHRVGGARAQRRPRRLPRPRRRGGGHPAPQHQPGAGAGQVRGRQHRLWPRVRDLLSQLQGQGAPAAHQPPGGGPWRQRAC